MGFSLGGGIGPVRGSVRLGGSRKTSPPSVEEYFFMVAGTLLFFGGTIAAMGLRGEGGITGRVLGALFLLISVGSLLYSPLVGTYFATSWVYFGLTKVHYFNLINLVLFDPPEVVGLDSIVLMFLQLIVMIVFIALVLSIPPLAVFLVLRKLHEKLELESNPENKSGGNTAEAPVEEVDP